MASKNITDHLIYLDCPTTGPLDVTAEWFNPASRESWLSNAEAARAMGMDWTTYSRAAGPMLGYEDKIKPESSARVLRCPGCGEIVRVWFKNRPYSTPTGKNHNRRSIDVVTGPRARQGRCTGVCLNGKRSCDCQCQGKCHGAGECQCDRVA